MNHPPPFLSGLGKAEIRKDNLRIEINYRDDPSLKKIYIYIENLCIILMNLLEFTWPTLFCTWLFLM